MHMRLVEKRELPVFRRKINSQMTSQQGKNKRTERRQIGKVSKAIVGKYLLQKNSINRHVYNYNIRDFNGRDYLLMPASYKSVSYSI